MNEKHFGKQVDWRLFQIETLELKCDLCVRVFKKKSHLLEHKENVHKVSKNGILVIPIRCARCANEFTKKSNAVRHEKGCKKGTVSDIPC